MADPRKFPYPPVIPLAGLLAGWGLGRIWPILPAWPYWSSWLGLILLAVSFLLAFWAVRTFLHHHTPIDPRGEVTEIVSEGPFRYSRNPMYVALATGYVGATLLFNLTWALVLLVPVLLALHFGVIRPEERYLAGKFGESYLSYTRRVRRWI